MWCSDCGSCQILSCLWASIDIGIASASESVRLIDADDGIFFIIVIVAVAVINLFKLNIVTILGSCVGLFFLYLKLADIKDQLGAFESLVTYGAGRTLLILGIILMLAGSVTAVSYTHLTLPTN